MDYKWKILVCELCGVYFAIDKTNEPNIISCPNCGRDDEITATGEYISSDRYYNEDGEEFK